MFTLRSATKQEAAAIRQLIHQVGINPMGLDWRRFLVIVDDRDRLLACGQIKPHSDGSLELASLAVVPECRGQGFAQLIVEQIKELYGPPLYLMCRAELQPFYRKFDFRSLVPGEMPRVMKFYYSAIAFVSKLLKRPPDIAIMLWEES
jgi:N-acetylglutamate synthase-like GNAT family acetyltransferase